MTSPLTQYVFRVMRRPNLPVRFIVDISRVIHVYINHIKGCHPLELSGYVPVIAQEVIVHEAIPYHLGNVKIVSQTRSDFFLLPLGLIIAPNINDRIRFPQDLGGYHYAEGSIVHVRHV